jgi:hypothetical protein
LYFIAGGPLSRCCWLPAFLGSLIEVTLLAFVGPRRHDDGGRDARDLHGQPLGNPAVMAFIALVLCPSSHGARPDQEPDHRRARGQSCAVDPLLRGARVRFFQNDFAGRVANRSCRRLALRIPWSRDRCHLVRGGAVKARP